jgi:peptidoglycan glycosyltransferase
VAIQDLHQQRKENRSLWRAGRVWFALAIAVGLSAIVYIRVSHDGEELTPTKIFRKELHRDDIANALGKRRVTAQELRDTLTFTMHDDRFEVISTIQIALQEKVEALYRRYDPLYAAFVAVDPDTGAVLAMADHSRLGHSENLALKSTYPAASVFKIVTSAAAIESAHMQPETAVPFNGSYTTLYKRNLTYKTDRWTRHIRLSEALGKSINSIFGKVAVHGIGRTSLQQYANAFGFNQAITFDMPVDISSVIVPEDDYGIAESGSGYTKRQTLSPLQGVLIAATIANGGNTPQPSIVKTVLDHDKTVVYEFAPSMINRPITSQTAGLLSEMMEKTITQGTARKIFNDYNRHPILSRLFIAAKTGSLTGDEPRGKYDWFVGFARSNDSGEKRIAFASMIVNDKFWRVKSAFIAREVLLEYYKDIPAYVSRR